MKYELRSAYNRKVIAEFDCFATCIEYVRNVCKHSVVIRNTKSGKQCNVSYSNHGWYFRRSIWYTPTI